MLTLRIGLAFAMLVAKQMFGLDWELNLIYCDENLVEIATSPVSRGAYRSSISLVQKNWRRDTPFDLEVAGLSNIWTAGS